MEAQNQESTIFTALFELDDMFVNYCDNHSNEAQNSACFEWLWRTIAEMAQKRHEIYNRRAMRYAYINRFLLAHTGKAQQRRV